MSKVIFSRVLDREYDWNTAQSGERLLNVRCQDAVGIDILIVEESIRRFQLCLGQRLGKGAVRRLGQLPGQGNQTCGAPSIAEVGCAELVDCPIGFRFLFQGLPLQLSMPVPES